MAPTPDRICQYLRTHPSASAKELSRALGLTLPDIRHHLKALLAEKRVRATGRRPGQGRGRPTTLYSYNPEYLPNNLASLVDALLDILLDPSLEDSGQDPMYRAAHLLAGSPIQADLKLVQRLNQAVKKLEKHNYQARWEAHSSGPRLFLGRCPYLAVINDHPELCKMDAHLLAELVGIGVEQIARQDLNSPETTWCVFTCGTGAGQPMG